MTLGSLHRLTRATSAASPINNEIPIVIQPYPVHFSTPL